MGNLHMSVKFGDIPPKAVMFTDNQDCRDFTPHGAAVTSAVTRCRQLRTKWYNSPKRDP
jgi:hypothetical protein